ncbi:hypothetical protein [Streptococcus infantarius]|uniref:hypothetical protein n=1 Tax=Streptococcus infantarius TaxID=102684 RepID=UPI0022E595CB|nr:hypothetical protein [Streptococcus infantarius]
MLEGFFPNFEIGSISLRRDSWLTLIVFVISTIFLPAVTEETFYRKNMILLDSKKAMIVTTFFSMLLYALEHSLSFWGNFLDYDLGISVEFIIYQN